MRRATESALADPTQVIANLQRQLDERTAERDALRLELAEAREQQTATAEVLGVINSSPGDLAPVWDVMLERALHLCDASFGNLVTFDGEAFHFVAASGHPEFDEWTRNAGPLKPGPGTTMARLIAGERVVQVLDIADDEVYRSGNTPVRRAFVEIGKFRTLLGIALRKDDILVGALHVYRDEVRSFSDKQIALLQNFAAQAVIAMENARLLTETREALEQQTATAEVLQVINSSPGGLMPVFDAILHKAVVLCEAAFGVLLTYEGEQFRAVALHDVPQRFAELMKEPFRSRGPGSATGRLVEGESVVLFEDIPAHPAYASGTTGHEFVQSSGARSHLGKV
jgi:transcriptional regulator with GAF, ATPase, and Fis domain